MLDNIVCLEYEFFGRVPSKKNSRITVRKTGRSFPSKKYSEWHEDCKKQFLAMKAPNVPIGKLIKMTCEIYYPDKRVADNTNKAESVHDLIVDLKIIKDDCYQVAPRTEQIGKYRSNDAGFKISLLLDLNDRANCDLRLISFKKHCKVI